MILFIVLQSFLAFSQEPGNFSLEPIDSFIQELDSIILVAQGQSKDGNLEAAISLLRSAEKIADSAGMELRMATIFLELGTAYRYQGDYETALSNFKKALQIHRERTDGLGECKALENINIIYQKQGQYERALDALFSVLEIKKKLGDEIEVAKTCLNLGVVYAKNGSEEQAISYFVKSKKILEKGGDDFHFAMVLNNLGNVHSAIDELEKSEGYYLQSIEIKKTLDNQLSLASSLNNLGDFYYRKTEYQEANSYFLQALNIVQNIEADDLKSTILRNLAYSAEMQSNYAGAFNYFYLYDSLNALLTEQKFGKAVAEFEVKFDTETKQNQILALEVENAAKAVTIEQEKAARAEAQYTRNALLMGMGFLLVITILALYAYRQKQQLNKQLKAKAGEISKQKDLISAQNVELQTISQTKEKLFSIVAHNLRGPLASLTGFSDIVKHYLEKGQQDKFNLIIQETDQTVQQLNSLVNNTLIWADSMSDKIPYNPERLNLPGVVAQVFSTIQTQANRKEIALSAAIPENLEVYTDVNFAKTILINLLNNALKFTPKAGKVTVEAKTMGKEVQVTVRDTGQGISPERLRLLFSETNSDSTIGTDGERGTGLGLKVCKEFVERGGGKLTVKSKISEGSQFIFTWPLYEQKM